MSLFILLRFFSAQRVKIHSLQERKVLWNVLIVDHPSNKNIIYSFLTVRKAL